MDGLGLRLAEEIGERDALLADLLTSLVLAALAALAGEGLGLRLVRSALDDRARDGLLREAKHLDRGRRPCLIDVRARVIRQAAHLRPHLARDDVVGDVQRALL